MSTEITTKDPCPLCLNNGTVNPLMDRPGQFFTNCRAGHKFEDTEELNMLRAQARTKYPNFYKSPETPKAMDPAARAAMNIVIDAETKKAIEEITGIPLTGGADLKGTIFAYVTDNKDKDAEIRSLRAQITTIRNRAAVRPGEAVPAGDHVVLNLPEWALEGGLAEAAEYSGKSVPEWCQEEFTAYLETYFSRDTPTAMITHDYKCDNDECGHVQQNVAVSSNAAERVRPQHCGRDMYEYYGGKHEIAVQEFTPFYTRNIHPDGKELYVRNKGDLQRYYQQYGVIHYDDPNLVAQGDQIVRKGARMGKVFDMGSRK